MRRRAVLLAVALAVAAAAPAGAAPALSPSVVGEPPQGSGVFRFPQAVGVSPGGSVVWVADQYSGVVQAFDAGGTPLRTVGERAVRREDGRFGVVGGVATDRSGHLYVLDAENERVQVLDAADGHPLASFGDGALFNLLGGNAATGAGISASGLAVAQAAPGAGPVVYVADQGNNRVARFQLSPTTLQPTAGPTFSGADVDLAAPQGIALDPSATRLYVADDDHHRVLVLDPATLALVGSVGTFGTGPGQMQNPYDVAVDAHQPPQLYVADNLNNRVDVFDAFGLGFLGVFGRTGYGPGLGNMEIVRSVGALADVPGGGVIAADTANNRVQRFDSGGAVVAAWGLAGRGAGYVTRPGGVTFAPDGGVTVADTFDHRIALFAADGTFAGLRGQVSAITGYAFAGSNPGQYNLPSGVAYDAAGNLWIADTGNDRVVELDPSGATPRSTGAGMVADPAGIATGPTGTYVADTGGGRVLLFSDVATQPTVVRTGLAHPAAVAVGPGGTPFVADDASVRDAAAGTAIAGPGGTTTWDHPAGLAVSPADGTLFVAERRPGTAAGARVVRGTPTGTPNTYTWDTIATEGDGPAQVIDPGGLAVSPDGGTLLVADTGNDRVLRFDAPGHAPPPTATLRVTIDGPARGIVVSDLPGIACVTDCRQAYGTGRTVTLTARAAGGSVLAGWSGACAGAASAPTCTLSMAGAQDVGATFTAPPIPPPAAPTGTTTTPPPPPPPPAPVRIRSVRLSTHVLHGARPRDRRRHLPARRATRATATVVLTRAARITAVVQQGRPGRRRGSACVAPTRATRRAPACTRFVALRRTRTLNVPGTTARFTLTTSFGAAAPLAPGSYRLAITALDAQGNRVGPAVASFRVTR
jgi:DNA-binding beta-propeller fold protein YncE